MDIGRLYENNKNALFIVVALVCIYLLFTYVWPKEGLEVEEEEAQMQQEVVTPVEDDDLAPVAPGHQQGGEIQPADLLPMNQEVVNFTQQFPSGQADVKDKNFLIPGYNIGINTVASSLKNANLQLRSDPYIPRQETGPWNQSTIMSSDLTNRKPLEIGTNM